MSSFRARCVGMLNSVERLLHMDLRYLARGTFWSLLSQAAAIVATLTLSVVMSRFVPKDVYGEYKYILSLVSILSIFSLSSLSSAVLQSVSKGFDGALQEGFRTNLRWSFAIYIGALALALYYFLHQNNVMALGVLVGGCLSPLITSASLAGQFLTAKKEWARLALYSSILGVALPAASLIVTALLTQNPFTLVCVYFVSNLAAEIFLYWYVMRLYKPDVKKYDSGMFSYAKHLSFMNVLGGIAGNLDQVLLFHYVGPAQLAVYNFAIGIPDQLKGPLKGLDVMLQVRFANYLPKDIRANMRIKSFLLLAFALVAIGVYILLAPFFYHILFPTYTDAIVYSQLYMFSFLWIPFTPSASYLSAKKLIKEQYISTVCIGVMQILLMAIGVIEWGLLGLVWSIVLTRIMTGLIWYSLYRLASRREIATV